MELEAKLKLEDIIESDNVAELLSDDDLKTIGRQVHKDYVEDDNSRSEWLERNKDYMKLAAQVVERKNFPWTNSANVKYPLVTTSAVQFAARAYPSLVSGPNVVRARTTGFDLDGSKKDKAINIGRHMSYQILEEMTEWEEDMDKLCLILPIVGCAFKKTYFDPVSGRNKSELVLARDLVVNYYASNLEDAPRKTHVLEFSSNDIFERVRAGVFSDIDFNEVNPDNSRKEVRDEISGIEESALDDDTPRVALEQHRLLDLDGDGYKEPYVVTIDEDTRQVFRIVPRFDAERVILNVQTEELIKIEEEEYFTKFSFIPNPDGGFYDIGFGTLLGPLNETVNTLINQLLDSGTLSNMQSGFISRGIRIKSGGKRFSPGEWKVVNSTGDDLRKGIVPLPVREPSNTLFSLLGTLVESGQRVSSVTEIFSGENPGQNQPATTTMMVVEQGLKVFTAIYKRMHRSLKKEYKKLYQLNKRYLSDIEYFTILDIGQEKGGAIRRSDYKGDDTDVVPASDPNIVTEAQKLAKAQGLLELMQLGLNAEEVKIRVLEAQEQPNIPALLRPNPPQPPPIEERQLQMDMAIESKKLEIEERRVESQEIKDEATSMLNLAKAASEDINATLSELKAALEVVKLDQDERRKDGNNERAVSGVEGQ